MKLFHLCSIFFCFVLSVGSPFEFTPSAFRDCGVSESWSYKIGKGRFCSTPEKQVVDEELKHQDKYLAELEYDMDYSQPNPRPQGISPVQHKANNYYRTNPAPAPSEG